MVSAAGTSAGRRSAARFGAVALAALALALAFAIPAQAGQIVYAHGGDLWAMNDDGSGQHPLVTAAQAGATLDSANNADPQPVSVQPGGDGVAFVARQGGSCPPQTSNCPALYSLVGGKVTRLTAAPAPCGSASVLCASEEEEPAVTADGRVVYERLDTASTFTCFYWCGFSGGYSEAYYSRKLDGSDAPTAWPVPHPAQEADLEGVDPDFEGSIASDPADPAKLAYQGNFFGYEHEPEPGKANYPLDIDASAGTATVNQPSYDDGFPYGVAFSADGSLVADVETGGTKGIWVYPAAQSWQSGSGSYYWALEDPDNGAGNSLDHALSGLTFVGNDELVFSANYNLYAIPSRCWSTDPEGSAANCKFPQDATQLTSDGSAAAPDVGPAWTSSTTPITAYAAPAPAPSPAPAPVPRAAKVAASHASLSGLAARRARLSFNLAGGSGDAALKKIVVKLPPGLSFAHARRALGKGVAVLSAAGKRLPAVAGVRGGTLAIVLKKPAAKVEVKLGPPAIVVAKSLAGKAAAGKAGKLHVLITVTAAGGATKHLTLTVKPK